MKHLLWGLLLAGLAATAGCVTLPPWAETPPPPPPAPAPVRTPPPIVTPDQVTESNAPAMLKALQAELDYAAEPVPVPPAPPPRQP